MSFNRLDYSQIDEETFYKLPRFAGASGEDVFEHLRKLHEICVNIIKPRGVSIDEFKFKVFPFSLINHALSWYSYLPLPVNYTYRDIERLFLIRYTTQRQHKELRNQIRFIQQYDYETFEDYFERFLRLLRWCPNIDFPEHILFRFLLRGMNPYELRMIDLMAGGSILDCTLDDMWNIFYARANETSLRAPSKSAPVQQEVITPNVHLQEESIPQTGHILDSLSDPGPKQESETSQVCSEDTEVVDVIIDQIDVMEEALQVVHTTCNDETKSESENFISSHCSNMITSHKEDEFLENVLAKEQVWGTLEKTRRKGKHMMKKVISSSSFYSGKVKSTFGWKPGWNFCASTWGATEKHFRRQWTKFDGVHPWAPNI